MLTMQRELSRPFLVLLTLPATAMGFALSVQISALSWILTTRYGLDIHEIGLVWAAGPLAGIEPPDYFGTETSKPDEMNLRQLQRYVDDLESSGADASSARVALHGKIAFPFVAIVMTLLAVPFAVTTGSRGALYGIGLGIALSIAYWFILTIFGAVGATGLLPPALAAWAPNLFFAAGATYMLLTVRT